MRISRRTLLLASAAAACAPAVMAQGRAWALPSGGRNGRIIRVTTLDAEGPGSITEAIKAKGPRIVVFEVGGVIDLNRKTLDIRNGDITLAGQTSPAPGITLIRGGVEISQGCRNVVIEHIAVRPGEAGAAKTSGWEVDGIYAYGASQIMVRNCSITWATDEGLSASGKRFGVDNAGAAVEDWRAATSHDIYFLRNIVAEGLSKSTHSKGEHSKGTLIHDNVRNAVIADSLYAHNMERNVLFKGGSQGVMTRCVVYNAGKRFAHYNLHAGEWGDHPFQTGEVEVTANVFLGGPSTDPKAAAFMLGGDGDLALTMGGNVMQDSTGGALAELGTFGSGKAKLAAHLRPSLPEAAPDLAAVLASCGSRPWDRDPIDARIVADVINRTGRIIDSEQDAGGYPVRAATSAVFREGDWNLADMTPRNA